MGHPPIRCTIGWRLKCSPAPKSIWNRDIYLKPPTPTYRVWGHGRGLSEDVAGIGTALQHGGSLRRVPRTSALARRMGLSAVRGSGGMVGAAKSVALRPVPV